MRVRVLYTNGLKTYDFFWLTHDEKEVYCGTPGSESKRSYHGSGKVHTTSEGLKRHQGWHAPLSMLKRQFHLMTVGFVNSDSWFNDQATSKQYRGKKSDAVLIIDGRSIPQGVPVNVSIGLLEPRNAEVLNSMIQLPQEAGIEAKQVLLATGVQPWVYVILYWLNETFFEQA